jgi:allophanate hydrolase subunit 2
MSIYIHKAGLYSSLQDKGRFAGMPYGVPISGAMDQNLYHFTNHILENPANSSSMEFYQQGLELEFTSPTFLCIGALGGDFKLNDKEVKPFEILKIKKGDLLKIKQLTKGNWGYIAVKGGFESEGPFNSQSFYEPITKRQFENDDVLIYRAFDGVSGGESPVLDMSYYTSSELEVFEGPEFYKLSQTLDYQLKHAEFSLSTSLNRMAYQIQERLANDLEEIITGPVLPGTVQFTPAGKMIVLMRDAQVTGGYPRILQFSEKSINQFSQMRVKSKFTFKLNGINSEKI